MAARGKIRRAERRGETIPLGYALDGEGRPTTDPKAALGGVVLPIARSIAELYGSRPGVTAPLLGTFLITAVYQNICVTAAMFLTGQASNPLAAKIAAVDLGPSAALDEVLREARAAGAEVVALHGDMGTADGPARVVEEAVARLGGLDALVSNAGINRPGALIEYADGAGSYKTIAEFPVAGLEKYRGPFLAACAKIGAR